jgi:hypothetical protein
MAFLAWKCPLRTTLTGIEHDCGLLRQSLIRTLLRRTQWDNVSDVSEMRPAYRAILPAATTAQPSAPDNTRCSRGEIGCAATEALRPRPFRAMLARSEGLNR